MINKIQNDNIAEVKGQSAALEGINNNSSLKKSDNDKNFFIDQSDISQAAFEKYKKEEDVKKFSEILLQSDEKEATQRVLEEIFSQKYSIDDDEFLNELLNNEEFLNDIKE